MAVTAGRRLLDRASSRFALAFLALLGLLLVRNGRLFSSAVYEPGDAAANSIITTQAKHFELLVGNYSRLGFSHPGPAFFYWQGLGEYLFHDLLPITPAPWNAQWLALLVLNAALVAGAVTIVAGWSGSRLAWLWCGAAVLLFAAAWPGMLSSAWMPHLYTAPFLLLLVAAASVAAGRTRHLWVLALAGGLLIHGHVEFLLFVPAIWGAALAWRWRSRRRDDAPAPAPRRDWLVCACVLAVFALPIALHVILHWPGEFGRYLRYGGGRGLHGLDGTAAYLLQFWADKPAAALTLAVALYLCLAVLIQYGPRDELRRFLAAGLGVTTLATALFAFYVARGIDDLSQRYVGQFYRAVPLALLLLAVAGAQERFATAPRAAKAPQWVAAAVALAAGFVVAAGSPALATRPEHLPELPATVATLSSYADGRSVPVDLEPGLWPEMTGLVVAGERVGQRVCARDPAWRFLVTAEFVCTDADIAGGRPVRLTADPPEGAAVLTRLGRAVLSTVEATPAGGPGP